MLLCTFTGYGQIKHRGCVSHKLDSINRANNPDFDKARTALEKNIQKDSRKQKTTSDQSFVYTIPVVVHVIYNPSTPTSNISDEQVLEQLEALNNDFRRLNLDAINTPAEFLNVAADTKIQFCLANKDPDGNTIEDKAILRVASTKSSYHYTSDDDALKALSYWPSDQYLNIWVTKLSSNVLGYAQFPSNSDLIGLQSTNDKVETDGVVIDYRVFGVFPSSNSLYNLGRTLTHEVGHWLGLLHIFGDNLNCDTDFVNDTPTQGINNEGMANCDTIIYSCGANEVMYQNYMDYTADQCMNLFTVGQTSRMHSAILTSPNRTALMSSKGCCGDDTDVFSPPYSQNFDNDFDIIKWDDTTFVQDSSWYQGISDFGYSAISSNSSGKPNSIVSPHINFENIETPNLLFDYKHSGISLIDTFQVAYEATCSENWIPIITISGSELATFQNGLSQTNWSTVQLPLPEIANKNLIRFRFTTSINDGDFYLDNVNIFNTSEELIGDFYPNPSSDNIKASLSYTGKHPVIIDIYDTFGRAVNQLEFDTTYSPLLNISLGDLSQGVYFLKVYVNEDTITERVIITK